MADSRIGRPAPGILVVLAACVGLFLGEAYGEGEVRTERTRDAEAEAREKPVIVRYLGARSVKILRHAGGERGRPRAVYAYGLALRVVDVSGRKVTTVYYPKEGREFAAFVEGVKSGEVQWIDHLRVCPRAESWPGDLPLLKSAETYDFVPGEERDGVYIYQSQGLRILPNVRGAVLAVTARKLGETHELLAPAPKGKGDADKVLSSIKPGELFRAKVKTAGERKVLQKVEAYTPPEEGVFKEVKAAMVGGQSFHAVTIAQDGDSVELLLPSKSRAGREHAAMSAAVAQIKPGTTVVFQAVDSKDAAKTRTLTAIEPAPVIPRLSGAVEIPDAVYWVRQPTISSTADPVPHIKAGAGVRVDLTLPRRPWADPRQKYAVPCIVGVSRDEARAAGLID